jgi:hypothetical protein
VRACGKIDGMEIDPILAGLSPFVTLAVMVWRLKALESAHADLARDVKRVSGDVGYLRGAVDTMLQGAPKKG